MQDKNKRLKVKESSKHRKVLDILFANHDWFSYHQLNKLLVNSSTAKDIVLHLQKSGVMLEKKTLKNSEGAWYISVRAANNVENRLVYNKLIK